MSKEDVIRGIYRSFAGGDAVDILATFEDDIEFRLAEGHPYRGEDAPWIGKDAVVRKFFAVAGPEWERWTIAVDDLIETENAVVVEGRYTGLYKPTGRSMDVQACHVWRFRGERIASFHQYLDSARLQSVMGRDDGAAEPAATARR